MLATLRHRDFSLLWVAGLISVAGDYAFIFALLLHVYRLTGSTLATAAVFAARFLPGVLIGSIAGVFVDRWDRKRTMLAADLTRAIVLLSLLIAPDLLWLVCVVAAAQGAVGLFFTPAENALLPTLVGEDRLVAANALNALNNNLGLLIGPALGSLLYVSVGFTGAVIVEAATYLGSALLIRLIAADARAQRTDAISADGSPWTRMVAEWRDGLGLVRRDRTLAVLSASTALAGIAGGIFLPLGLAPLVLDVLGGTSAQVGWFGTTQAVGGLIAGLVVARLGHRVAKRWLVGGGMVGLGMADLGACNARLVAAAGNPAVGVAMGWMALAGLPAVAAMVGRQALVQAQTADAYRGRVFGALGAIRDIAMLAGFGIGGVLGDIIGLVPVLSAAAAMQILGGLIALWLLPREEHEPVPRRAEVSTS